MVTVKTTTIRNITSNLEILRNEINIGENIKKDRYNGIYYLKKDRSVTATIHPNLCSTKCKRQPVPTQKTKQGWEGCEMVCEWKVFCFCLIFCFCT